MKIRRGYLYSANLDPRFGSEAGKTRPVLVLQTDDLNPFHTSTLICPLTTKVRKELEYTRIHLKKGEAGLSQESDIMLDQIRSIDNRRFKKEIGKLDSKTLIDIEEKIKILLDFKY
ncbi:MAG: type II toxin-antitoxin system PemK/MazF family toxin [Deltaproteobacteria bacterium]|nr:type II toxin-antitoxin system PemK/MazF family toxin [Deltaproteobacteria bacterium]